MNKNNSDKNESSKQKYAGRREILQGISVSVCGVLLAACAKQKYPTNNAQTEATEVEQYMKTHFISFDKEMLIEPKGYIDWLKENVFKHGELDNLPKHAVILHDAKVEQHLQRLGFTDSQYRELQTGSTDPNLLYVVKRNNGSDFILNRGLPGSGGIATQAAELYALGVESIIHIGTCGLIGDATEYGLPIISKCAYKDSAALMLSVLESNEINILAYPSKELNKKIQKEFGDGKYTEAIGYTIPIYYFQPKDLLEELIIGEFYSNKPRPSYIEMEAASLFETAKLMKTHAASLVVGADRYTFKDGNIMHEFYDVDSDAVKSLMFEISLRTFDTT